MPRFLTFVFITGLIIWAPSVYFGYAATQKAEKLSGGRYCWMVRNPNVKRGWTVADEMVLSTDRRTPFRFWKDIFSFSEKFDYVRPHYGIVIPDESAAPQFYAWSYKANNFWDIEEHLSISVIGIFPFSSECEKLLSDLS